MIGGAAVVLLAIGACPGQFTGPSQVDAIPYAICDHEGDTFGSVDDKVCSATTDGFDCCYWQNTSATGGLVSNRYYSYCYENALGDAPCGNSLAQTQLDHGILYSRNCSDHTPASTTTPPAQPADDSGLSAGAVAGISVGAVAFVGLAAAAAVCL